MAIIVRSLATNHPFVVRANLQNLRLFTAAGTHLAMTTWLTELARHEQAACSVWLEATPMRLGGGGLASGRSRMARL